MSDIASVVLLINQPLILHRLAEPRVHGLLQPVQLAIAPHQLALWQRVGCLIRSVGEQRKPDMQQQLITHGSKHHNKQKTLVHSVEFKCT